jgi:glycosyltransferase involved in cell wall biosynthesis
MKRILILSQRDIRHKLAGGAPLYVHEIFKRLADKYEVAIVSTAERGLPIRERIDGLEIFRIPFASLSRLTIPISVVTRLVGQADIVVDNGDVAFPWLTPIYSRKPKICIVYQVAGDIFRFELPRPLSDIALGVEKWVYRAYGNDKIVVCSPSTKDDLLRFGLSSENVIVIRPGIDDALLRFESSGRKFDSPTIICVSRFKRYKGLHYAIGAMQHILAKVPNATLIIAGNGDPREVEFKLSQTNFADTVKILKRSPHSWDDEKKLLLSNSHLVLVPSVKEGYGIVVIEANACGTPAIGWNVPGLRDSIIDGETGVLVPFGDVKKLGEAVAAFLMDERGSQEMSRRAIKWARSHSWDAAAEEFSHVIESIQGR